MVTIHVSLLLDSSLPTAVREGPGGVRAVPPQAAQPALTPDLGEPPQAASSPEELQTMDRQPIVEEATAGETLTRTLLFFLNGLVPGVLFNGKK